MGRYDVHFPTAVAVREFEAWFLAGLGGLRSHSAVSSSARFDSDPESPRDAKGRLSQMMTEPYREPLHQARFASAMDIQEPRRTRSFAHLVSCVERLLAGGSTSAQ